MASFSRVAGWLSAGTRNEADKGVGSRENGKRQEAEEVRERLLRHLDMLIADEKNEPMLITLRGLRDLDDVLQSRVP